MAARLLLLTLKRIGFPKFFAQELFERIAQQFHQVWVDIGDFPSFCIQDEDPILGCLKEPPVAQLGYFSAHQQAFLPRHFLPSASSRPPETPFISYEITSTISAT